MKPSHIQNLLLLVATLAAIPFLCEGLLLVFGFPATTTYVAHRPNTNRVFKNPEFTYRFKTNKLGLRYPNIPIRRTLPDYRVFLIGDSFLEGPGVEDEATFCSLVEKQFTSPSRIVRFINGGFGGSGTFMQGRILYQIGFRYDPDAVLICYYANDVSNATLNQRPELMRVQQPQARGVLPVVLPRLSTAITQARQGVERMLKGARKPFLEEIAGQARGYDIPEATIAAWQQSVPPELAVKARRDLMNNSILFYGLLRPTYWSDALDLNTEQAQAGWAITRDLLSDIIAQCRQRHIKVGLVYIPTALQFDPHYGTYAGSHLYKRVGYVIRDEWLTEDAPIQRELGVLAKESDVPFLDMTPALRRAVHGGGHIEFILDGHLNEAGHRVAADTLASWLKESSGFDVAR